MFLTCVRTCVCTSSSRVVSASTALPLRCRSPRRGGGGHPRSRPQPRRRAGRCAHPAGPARPRRRPQAPGRGLPRVRLARRGAAERRRGRPGAELLSGRGRVRHRPLLLGAPPAPPRRPEIRFAGRSESPSLLPAGRQQSPSLPPAGRRQTPPAGNPLRRPGTKLQASVLLESGRRTATLPSPQSATQSWSDTPPPAPPPAPPPDRSKMYSRLPILVGPGVIKLLRKRAFSQSNVRSQMYARSPATGVFSPRPGSKPEGASAANPQPANPQSANPQPANPRPHTKSRAKAPARL